MLSLLAFFFSSFASLNLYVKYLGLLSRPSGQQSETGALPGGRESMLLLNDKLKREEKGKGIKNGGVMGVKGPPLTHPPFPPQKLNTRRYRRRFRGRLLA